MESVAKGQTDTELFEQGKRYYEQEKYKQALPYFLYVKEHFIRSPYAGVSRFYAGECHFARKDYKEASTEYESFLMFFPEDPVAPEAQYKLGVCYFERSRGPDRDQSMLNDALTELQKVQENYPEHEEFVIKADEYIQKTKMELARHEFVVGLFYRREQHYDSSNLRFEYLVREYPESDLRGDALYYIGLNYLDLKQPDEAATAFLKLIGDYPESRYVPSAREHLEQLEVVTPEPESNQSVTAEATSVSVLSTTDAVSSPVSAENALEGYVLTIRESTVTTDLIRDDGIQEGMRLKIYRDGVLVGTLRLTVLYDGFSMGEIESIEPGMTVREDDMVCCPESD
jgi:outer membrane protein assembly factor BamD